MNKKLFIIFIIVFLVKTGNVFSDSNIFNVDNIEVNTETKQNREELLNIAFKKGFQKLVKKILLKKDEQEVLKTNLEEIKKLVSTYQIIEGNNATKENIIKVNLTFNREKLNSFFYIRGISYADIEKTELLLFPILVQNENFYLFSDNHFYNNWNIEEKNEFINYVLPAENIEDIQTININKNNLETFEIEKILSNYDIKNSILLIITPSKEKTDIFIKGTISNNKIVKNISSKNNSQDKNTQYNNIIEELKSEINEIWKQQNLIDVRTPSFLNIVLDIKNQNDLLNLQETLNRIELIENYQVLELNKKYAKIKIKYFGKINKIKSKFDEQGIKITISNNQWKLKLI